MILCFQIIPKLLMYIATFWVFGCCGCFPHAAALPLPIRASAAAALASWFRRIEGKFQGFDEANDLNVYEIDP